jgi:indoleacetamide hydrolase
VADAIMRAKAQADLNAFVSLDENSALAAARRADAAANGKRCKPLLGVPIVVKDNIEVAGLPNTGGTPALKAYVPKADAPVVARLRDAGAIVIGKTQMHELAFGISGYNPAYDSTRSAGGSSSGTAAALGARIVAIGLGTDTGGSVRVPCAFNGCAALWPTVGRYSSKGVVPLSHTRDTIGPMALAMADIELLDRVITGAPAVTVADLKGVRLGLVKELLSNMDADTQEVFDAAIEKLRSAGATVEEVEMPALTELNGAISFPVVLYEAYDDLVAYLRHTGTGITIEQVAEQAASPDVKGAYQGLVIPRKLPGPENSVVDAKPAYQNAINSSRPALQKLYAQTFTDNRLDALVFPTVPKIAMPANPESSSMTTLFAVIQNTDPSSNAGILGVQLPIGIGAASGLPVGLEIDGPAGSDRRLVAIAMAIENLVGTLPTPASERQARASGRHSDFDAVVGRPD